MSTNWKESLSQLQAMRSKFFSYEPIMSAYEKTINGQELKRVTESVYPVIAAGVLAEHTAAIQHYQAKSQAAQRAKSGEINRWQADRLNAELTNVQMRIRLAAEGRGPAFSLTGPADVGGRLKAIYQEAQDSGDIYKQRAACEVMCGLNLDAFAKEAKPVVLSVANQAKRDLPALRITPEVSQALASQEQALDAYLNAREAVIDAAEALGEKNITSAFGSSNFSKALKQVRLKNGEVEILAPDDPEVTGLLLKEAPSGSAGG